MTDGTLRLHDLCVDGDGQADVATGRLASQLLAGVPADDVLDVVQRLLAVQAQDPRGARLAIRARTRGLHASNIDRALTADRSLVITWLNRGTLHLVRGEDYWWLHQLTAPQLLSRNARRLTQEGVSPAAAERGVAVIETALAKEGPLVRQQLRERIASAGVPVEGQALVHVLMLAALRGVTVRGPVVGREHAYALVHDWLGKGPAPVERDTALGELARRYLRGHGPASDRDLARWAGLPLRDARRAFAAIATQLVDRDDGLADLRDREGGEGDSQPRLLGAFDPLLCGWTTRQPFTGAHDGAIAVDGLFRPFALVRTQAVGTWSWSDGRVVVHPFAALPSSDTSALQVEARDVERFLTAKSGSA